MAAGLVDMSVGAVIAQVDFPRLLAGAEADSQAAAGTETIGLHLSISGRLARCSASLHQGCSYWTELSTRIASIGFYRLLDEAGGTHPAPLSHYHRDLNGYNVSPARFVAAYTQIGGHKVGNWATLTLPHWLLLRRRRLLDRKHWQLVLGGLWLCRKWRIALRDWL